MRSAACGGTGAPTADRIAGGGKIPVGATLVYPPTRWHGCAPAAPQRRGIVPPPRARRSPTRPARAANSYGHRFEIFYAVRVRVHFTFRRRQSSYTGCGARGQRPNERPAAPRSPRHQQPRAQHGPMFGGDGVVGDNLVEFIQPADMGQAFAAEFVAIN